MPSGAWLELRRHERGPETWAPQRLDVGLHRREHLALLPEVLPKLGAFRLDRHRRLGGLDELGVEPRD